MSPIITSPQIVVGAMGRMQRLPRFISPDTKEVHEAHVMNMTWAGDHRALDGATLARFAQYCKELLENPNMMFLHMK